MRNPQYTFGHICVIPARLKESDKNEESESHLACVVMWERKQSKTKWMTLAWLPPTEVLPASHFRKEM